MHSRPEASDENLDRQLIPKSNPDKSKRMAAWVEWWEIHWINLLRYILSHSVREAEAQTILQDTFGVLLIKVEDGSFDPSLGKPIIAYAFGVAKNCVRVHQRAEAKLTDLEERDRTISFARSVETKCQALRNIQILRDGIDQLSDKQRLVMDMLVNGFSIAEIAEETGLSTGAVRQRAFDARMALRDLFSDTIEDDIWD